MPSRKQRRRREKTLRHEYETVLLDADGNEIPIDPEELRAEREARKERSARPADKQQQPARGSRRGREPQPPSWRRAFRRGGVMGGFMFVLFAFIYHGGSPVGRAVTGAMYGLAFIPMTYWMDRFAYRMYERRQARPDAKSQKKSRAAKES